MQRVDANGVRMHRDDGTTSETDFVFVGDVLALDLVNTEVVARGRARDLLGDALAWEAWWRAARARYPELPATFPGIAEVDPEEAPGRLLAAVKELRGALRRISEAVARAGDGGGDCAGDWAGVAAGDLAVLNRVLEAGHQVVAVAPDGTLRPVVERRGAGADAVLLPIAHSALGLFTGKDPARLHRCANERCVLLFYDTTKSATRRWCSVGCMNRARSSARHRARKLAALDTPGGVHRAS